MFPLAYFDEGDNPNDEWHDIQGKQWSYNPNLDPKNQPNQGLFNQHIVMSWN